MIESIEPQTSEEDAALRELDAKHRRRHRWVALLSSVIVSFHTPVILFTLWHDWPLDVRVLGWLAWVGVNALVGLGMLGWSLRDMRVEEAMERQGALQDARWRARDRAWREPMGREQGAAGGRHAR